MFSDRSWPYDRKGCQWIMRRNVIWTLKYLDTLCDKRLFLQAHFHFKNRDGTNPSLKPGFFQLRSVVSARSHNLSQQPDPAHSSSYIFLQWPQSAEWDYEIWWHGGKLILGHVYHFCISVLISTESKCTNSLGPSWTQVQTHQRSKEHEQGAKCAWTCSKMHSW